MNERSVFLPDEAATLAMGQRLAQALTDVAAPRAIVIYLQGKLGAGKTTLSRGFLHALGHRGNVKSPTYTLVEPYELSSSVVYHFDLYRLKDPQELEFIGVEDYFEHGRACLVEWPERGAGEVPAADLVITLALEAAGRQLVLNAVTTIGEKILHTMSAGAFTPATK